MGFKVGEIYEMMGNVVNRPCGSACLGEVKYIRMTHESDPEGSSRGYVILDSEFNERGSCSYCYKEKHIGNALRLVTKSKGVKKEESLMSKLTTMFKMLVDSDTQTLKKAGFINGDLELTAEGENALLAIEFAANKTALVRAAQEVVDEEEKDK